MNMKMNKLASWILVLSIFSSMVIVEPAKADTSSNSGRSSTGVYTPAPVLYVPENYANLQDAINQVPDGGIIEISAGTYTYNQPYKIININKSFTIRAANGSGVTLNGGGAHEILQLTNSNVPGGQGVLFNGITFANGYTAANGSAAGVTIVKGNATFFNCVFSNNHGNQPNTGGGGTTVAQSSTVLFVNSIWSGNTAKNYGGGLADEDNSRVYIHNSQFINNRTNLPGHLISSAGGGIHVGNSILRVSNTRFESNQAGYTGGGIYVIGSWIDPVTTPASDVIVANSTFINNQAVPDPGIHLSVPTEGGALHVEDQATAKIYNSRFITNNSMNGAVTMYRSILQLFDDVFLGNRATGGGLGGFGGAVSAVSNDTSVDGNTNRRSATLTVENSYFQGRYGSITTVGEEAGGIYIAGDSNRTYGANGVSQIGDTASNRASVTITNSVFNDLDVQNSGYGGMGGAVLVDLANLTIQNSLFLNSDALGGSGASGGGVAVIRQSVGNITGSTFAKNKSDTYGGAVYFAGSQANISNSKLIENTLPTKYGSAIFTTIMESGYNLAATGTVSGNIFSNNSGLPYIFDDDRDNGPINDIRYNSNQFYNSSGASAPLYSDSIQKDAQHNYQWQTVAQLNSLVVQRSNGTSTDKSQVDNTTLSTAPVVGSILAVPYMLSNGAPGDGSGSTAAYVGYAWSGGSAMLDGQSISGNAGVSTVGPGNHTLNVGGNSSSTTVTQTASPAAGFNVTQNNSQIVLNWSVTSGSFLDAVIDHGVSIPSSANGSIQVSPPVDTTYYFYAITKEGGVVKTINTGTPLLSVPASVFILVGQNLPVNHGGVGIQNVGGGTLSWTATAGNPNLIKIQNASGQTNEQDLVTFEVDGKNLTLGSYQTYIDINAGSAGSQMVDVNILSVEHVYQVLLPITMH